MKILETEHSLSFITKKGKEIESVFGDLALLRIAVFHDYPYLYEGTIEYELEYLKTYSNSDRSFLFAIYDHQKMVGATTCIPLSDEMPEVKKAFEDSGFDINNIFYFGESILLSDYRGYGFGHRFFNEREAHARSFTSYTLSCFCSVDRGENHPQKPDNYRPNNIFWTKRGYTKEPFLRGSMEWPDIGETTSSSKKMIFWTKPLN